MTGDILHVYSTFLKLPLKGSSAVCTGLVSGRDPAMSRVSSALPAALAGVGVAAGAGAETV